MRVTALSVLDGIRCEALERWAWDRMKGAIRMGVLGKERRRWAVLAVMLIAVGVTVAACGGSGGVGEPVDAVEGGSTPAVTSDEAAVEPTAGESEAAVEQAEPVVVETPVVAEPGAAEPEAAVVVVPEDAGRVLEVVEYAVPAGSRPHDVAPAEDGGVWYTAQGGGGVGLA